MLLGTEFTDYFIGIWFLGFAEEVLQGFANVVVDSPPYLHRVHRGRDGGNIVVWADFGTLDGWGVVEVLLGHGHHVRPRFLMTRRSWR